MTSFTKIAGINLPDIGGLAIYLEKECVDRNLNTIKQTLNRLSSPKASLDISVSGAIMDELNKGGGYGALFSKDFVSKYADDVALAVLAGSSEYIKDKTGYSPEEMISGTLDTIYRYINVLFMANNNILYFLMKILATNIVSQLQKKLEREAEINIYLTALHNVVSELAKGDPIFNRYLENLRQALSKVVMAKSRLLQVQGTLKSKNIWLSRPFKEAQTLLADARMLIRPSTGGNPYTEPFYKPGAKSVAEDDPVRAAQITAGRLIQAETDLPTRIPSAEELAALEDRVNRLKSSPSAIKPEEMDKVDNMMLVPILTKRIIESMRDYAVLTLSINGMISTFLAGVGSIQTALYDQLKNSSLQLLQTVIDLTQGLESSMADSLGQQVNYADKKYRNPVKLTAMSFKWVIDISAIISALKLFPKDSLKDFTKQMADVKAYTDAVNNLKKLDKVSSGNAVLEATDAQEAIGNYERQMFTGLLQCNAAITDSLAAKRALPIMVTLVARNELAMIRDRTIIGILNTFIAYEFEGEKEFNRLINSINDMLATAGMDRALDLWKSGDYAKFFKLNARTATYIGAGLEAVAMLKDCFAGTDYGFKFDALNLKLEREKDLLDLKIGFDFEKIFKENLKVCKINLELSGWINLDEIFCKLAQQTVGAIFSPLNDLVSTPESASGT